MSKWTSTLISYKPYLERGNNTNTSGAKRGKGAARNPLLLPSTKPIPCSKYSPFWNSSVFIVILEFFAPLLFWHAKVRKSLLLALEIRTHLSL